eukprot:CAMPEP_0185619556 /NCGR_PEP_ID=MMETSP0436-20130131/50946_1 /TAXON_ID=626734 ORGANISM="Favella taraikaensis, Strain Fe Narragansett Bay" /NCGR_SAMPLE_ID=MMETSP0436 /ASSEMBLY_ACC=CAM_ASM_000390 /LENGTH=39 /DNA_ID= /DNA_START= /DNA_END= /DNA_ORIENTATION=
MAQDEAEHPLQENSSSEDLCPDTDEEAEGHKEESKAQTD